MLLVFFGSQWCIFIHFLFKFTLTNEKCYIYLECPYWLIAYTPTPHQQLMLTQKGRKMTLFSLQYHQYSLTKKLALQRLKCRRPSSKVKKKLFVGNVSGLNLRCQLSKSKVSFLHKAKRKDVAVSKKSSACRSFLSPLLCHTWRST